MSPSFPFSSVLFGPLFALGIDSRGAKVVERELRWVLLLPSSQEISPVSPPRSGGDFLSLSIRVPFVVGRLAASR